MAQDTKKRLPPHELAIFFDSFAMLMQAGVAANESPEIIAEDTKGTRVAEAAGAVQKALESGETYVFSEAMEKSGWFPPYAVEMASLGETSGRLEEAASSLGIHYRREDTLNQNIRSAIMGPLILLLMMGVVLVFLLAFVLPVFRNVFASLGLAGGSGMGAAFAVAWVCMAIVGVLLVVVAAVFFVYLTPGGREKLGRLAQKLPFTGNIHYLLTASRFTEALSMLLTSGIGSSEAFGRARAVVDNKQFEKELPAAQAKIDEGADVSRTLVELGVLQGTEAKILLSASRAGRTEVAMQKISTIYMDEANERIDRTLGALEPALVGIVSVAIGVILISVMLPLTNLMSSLV